MGDAGWWPIIGLVILFNPVVAGTGILTGFAAARRLHAASGVVSVPASYWLFYSLFYRVDHFWTLLPALAIAGLIWSGAAFALKVEFRK